MKYVYILKAGGNNYKVGQAINVGKRVATIQTSNPEKVEVLGCKLVANENEVERKLHDYLVEHKSGGGTEWFRLTPDVAIEVLIQLHHEPELKIIDQSITAEALLTRLRAERAETLTVLHQLLKRVQPPIKESVPRVVAPPKPKAVVPSSEEYDRKAIEVFREAGRASTSMLQYKLGIGYGKAARIVDSLDRQGLIGPSQGSLGRELLV